MRSQRGFSLIELLVVLA
ncbi:prepilin-type N-terminal cleavage/methylation domain-containing protein, partial [Pseudomonas syringae]